MIIYAGQPVSEQRLWVILNKEYYICKTIHKLSVKINFDYRIKKLITFTLLLVTACWCLRNHGNKLKAWFLVLQYYGGQMSMFSVRWVSILLGGESSFYTCWYGQLEGGDFIKGCTTRCILVWFNSVGKKSEVCCLISLYIMYTTFEELGVYINLHMCVYLSVCRSVGRSVGRSVCL